MLREETSKTQYEVRPTLFIHAGSDAEARDRMIFVTDALNALLRSDNRNAVVLAQWMYTDVEMRPGCLVESGWPDGEDRVVQ